jgi:hypothetical protein
MNKVVTRPLLDVIGTLETHWFFLCCGALVNISFDAVKSFAEEYVFFAFQPTLTHNSRSKPANLFAFNAPSFHPIYATTFLLDFFQYTIIEGRTFDSIAGQLLNTSSLSRHTGIQRFWTRDLVTRHCELKWAHSRTRPWGEPVPFQCPDCRCIQAWDQKGNGASSELSRDVTIRCSYRGTKGQCTNCLTFVKSTEPFKPVKLSEGIWMAVGLEKSDFL